jgi:aspartate-semialdehyde dehydrogenase
VTHARSVSGLPIALVEPTSLLGRDVKAALKERAFPASKIHLFHQASQEGGILAEDDDEVAFVAPLTPDALEPCAVAFLCGPADGTARFLATRTDSCLAIDLSGARGSGPLAVPSEAGAPRPLPPGKVLVAPHPVAFVLAEAIATVDALVPVGDGTAAIDRPASELGKAALDELFAQAVALAAFRPVPKDVLGTQGAFNAWRPADSDSFEGRVADDVAALLGRPFPLGVLSARTGVFHGHFLRLELRLSADAPPAAAVLAAFRARKDAFEVVDPENLSGPVESAGRDETLVLHAGVDGRRVRLTLAADHLRRAGALLAVRLAEQLLNEGRLQK